MRNVCRCVVRLRFLFVVIIVLAVPVILSLTAVRLLFSQVFLEYEYQRMGFPGDPYGFSVEDRLEYGGLVVRYLVDGLDESALSDLRFSDGSVVFSDRELAHLFDVGVVVGYVFWILVVVLGVFLFCVCLSLFCMTMRSYFFQGLWRGSILSLSGIASILIFALTAWDVFFEKFHQLFFADGTWRFYYSDTLIRLFPEQFWFDAAVFVGGLTGLGALGLMACISKIRRHTVDNSGPASEMRF